MASYKLIKSIPLVLIEEISKYFNERRWNVCKINKANDNATGSIFWRVISRYNIDLILIKSIPLVSIEEISKYFNGRR